MVNWSIDYEEENKQLKQNKMIQERINYLRKMYFMTLMQQVNHFDQVSYVPMPELVFGLSALCVVIAASAFRKYIGVFPFNLIIYCLFVFTSGIFFALIDPHSDIVYFLYFNVVFSTFILWIDQLSNNDQMHLQSVFFFLLFSNIIVFQMNYFFFDLSYLQILLVMVGNFLFCVYMIMDTQTQVGGKKFDWNNDDWIIGSFLIYFDVFMVGLRVCKLLSRQIFGTF